MKFFAVLLFVILCYSSVADAHEWTPTYFQWKPSYVNGISTTKMKIRNARKGVDYYEIQVLDSEMNPLKFAATERIIYVPYLGRRTVDIYIPDNIIPQAMYACTRSKIRKDGQSKTFISSRICSKAK